jgi:hypothetical protein
MAEVFANAPVAQNWTTKPTTCPVGYTLNPGVLPDDVNVPRYDQIEYLGAWLVGYLEGITHAENTRNEKKED